MSIEKSAVLGTVLFSLTAIAAAVAPDRLDVAAIAVDLALFGAGCVLFVWAYAIVVGRSRTEEIAVAGVYFLAGGAAPGPVRRILLGALAVQTVVAVATAAARPFTPLAFGILVPVFGLGCAGMWAARHGSFPPRRRRTAS